MTEISEKNISINDYNYTLPQNRIAHFPLEKRDESKLLIYRNREIKDEIFRNIGEYLPSQALLVFNDSKVINARVRFEKSTGSKIEVFFLEPAESNKEYAVIMKQTACVKWKCFIGGVSKWKEKQID